MVAETLKKVIEFKNPDDYTDSITIYLKDNPERLFKVVICIEGEIRDSDSDIWIDEEETKQYVKELIEKWNWQIMSPYWILTYGKTFVYDYWELETD